MANLFSRDFQQVSPGGVIGKSHSPQSRFGRGSQPPSVGHARKRCQSLEPHGQMRVWCSHCCEKGVRLIQGSTLMNSIIYLVGLVVVVMAILSFIGIH